MTLTLRRGSDDGVFVGATGVIYAGDSKDYLKDGGKAVAFVVDEVNARTATVHVTAGTVTAAIAAANPRVVVRAREYKDLCSARTAGTVNGIAIDDCVFKRIRRWDASIEQAAKAHGLDPNLVRGLIAAETGGDSREVSTSGYKGLMQASNDAASHLHLEAETSIDQGSAHLASKVKVLKKFGYDKLGAAAQIGIALAAYDAGEGTVSKALEYARAAGDAARWAEEASYVRALIYYGAYDSEAAFPGWVEQQPAAQRAKLNADRTALIAKAQKERLDFATRTTRWRICAPRARPV